MCTNRRVISFNDYVLKGCPGCGAEVSRGRLLVRTPLFAIIECQSCGVAFEARQPEGQRADSDLLGARQAS